MKKVGTLLCALLWCTHVAPCDFGFFALLHTIKRTVRNFSFFGPDLREYAATGIPKVELANLEQNKEDRLAEREWRVERDIHFRNFTTDWLAPIPEGESV